MSPYIPQGEPRKLWVKYEDESYEPVNEDENIHNKKLKSDKPDWFVVTEKPDWRPKTYANTKRGRQGKKELGTRQQMGQQAPTQNAFAWNDEKTNGPIFKTMEVKPNAGSNQPNTGGFTGRMKPEDKTIMGWTLGEVADWTKRKEQEDAEAAQKRNSAQGNFLTSKTNSAYPNFGQQPRTQRLAQQAQAPKQQPNQTKPFAPLHPQDENDIQPQYRLMGHAVAYEDEDRARKAAAEKAEATKQSRNSINRPGPAALAAAEKNAIRKYNARTDVDHRTEQEKMKDSQKHFKPEFAGHIEGKPVFTRGAKGTYYDESGYPVAEDGLEEGFTRPEVMIPMLLGARAFTKGSEFPVPALGHKGRVAPLGNRTRNKYGQLPHYHKGKPNPQKPGESLPGQSPKRHRPWESKSTDKSFKDRF